MIDIATKTKDVYTWIATYHDGTQIPEFDHTRSDGRGFAEIDSSQVAVLELEAHSLEPNHRVSIPEGATPVFFRRRSTIAFQGMDTPDVSVKHCIGWKKDEQAVYLFVFKDGSTLLSSDLRAV